MARTASVSEAQVLDAAGRLFYEHGIRATGVAEVVTQAGCGKQALYRLFPSKDDLVAAYLQAAVTEREASAARAEEAAGSDPNDRLLALTQDVASWAGKPGFKGCVLRNYVREYPGDSTKAKEVAESYLLRSKTHVVNLAQQACPEDYQRVADVVWLVHEGLYSSSQANPLNLNAGVQVVADLLPRGDTRSSPRPTVTATMPPERY